MCGMETEGLAGGEPARGSRDSLRGDNRKGGD